MAAGSETDLVDDLRRYRDILKWETNLLRSEVASRGLATIAGKKAYQNRHSDGRSLTHKSPQLSEELSVIEVGSLPLVSLPYLVPHHEEALDLLFHQSHKLGYRLQSAIELGLFTKSETVRLLYLLSKRCASISTSIATHASPTSRKSDQDAVISVYKERPTSAATSLYKQHRISWESTWGSPVFGCGSFHDITTLSPMYLTPCIPRIIPSSGFTTKALQIYSFRIFDLDDKLNWPLYVYGVVAARDTMDGNRNLLFSRSRTNGQLLTEKDCFLHLTGPSRAILAEYPVDFEVELRTKYGTESQDKALISSTNHHHFSSADTAYFPGRLCSAELSLETLHRVVQATILSVRVVGVGYPSKAAFQVACYVSTPDSEVVGTPSRLVVLVDDTHVGSDGHLNLSRNVVSVVLGGSLSIIVKGCTESVVHRTQIDFDTQHCQISTGECGFGEWKLQVNIAWSLLVRDKLENFAEGYVLPMC